MADRPDAIPRYPLEWPAGWRRTPRHQRRRASFSHFGQALTVAVAMARLQSQLDLLGVRSQATLSTNVSLRIDGSPRSGEPEPADPGASVWFNYKGKATVLATDKWDRVADNIGALAAHIDAIRRVDRYGVGSIEQALAGYKALPADTAADWKMALGVPAEFDRWSKAEQLDVVQKLYFDLAKQKHPDITQDDGAAMAHLNRARDYALQELEG